jgi:hypothetical protein
MKVVCLTAVYKRPEITEVFYKAFAKQQQLAALEGVDLSLCVVASNESDADLARKYWHEPVMAANKPLGAKHNAGLSHVMQYEFDYLMQLGSDDVLCDFFWRLPQIKAALENQLPVFGLNRLIFFDVCGWRAKRVQVLNPFGAGRFISKQTLNKAVWCNLIEWTGSYSGKNYQVRRGDREYVPIKKIRPNQQRIVDDTPVCKLWQDEKNSGLDYSSESRLIRVLSIHEGRARVIAAEDAVMDLKGVENIHSYDKITGVPLSTLEVQELHEGYSIMNEVQRLRMQKV